MPRAVTRATSSSFATGAPYSHRGSSLNLSSGRASSILDMYPSPRPSKATNSSSKLGGSSSSPLNRKVTVSSAPLTPPTNKREKRKRADNDARSTKSWDEQIETCLQGYQIEMDKELQKARQALEMSIVSARAQMEVGILVYPRSILMTKMEDFICQTPFLTDPDLSKMNKMTQNQVLPPAPSNKRPRIAKPGEVVYSSRGSPILIQRSFGINGVECSEDDDEDEDEEEPSFDTAGDNSVTSESFSLPDVAAITAEVEKEHRNKILSSEGYYPRSSASSRFHRSNRSSSR